MSWLETDAKANMISMVVERDVLHCPLIAIGPNPFHVYKSGTTPAPLWPKSRGKSRTRRNLHKMADVRQTVPSRQGSYMPNSRGSRASFLTPGQARPGEIRSRLVLQHAHPAGNSTPLPFQPSIHWHRHNEHLATPKFGSRCIHDCACNRRYISSLYIIEKSL